MSSYLYDHAYHIRYRFDKKALNECFGFENREFFLSSAVVGIRTKRRIEHLSMQLPFIDGTGFFTPDLVIERAYEETLLLRNCKATTAYPKFSYTKERLHEAVLQRRSIRSFSKKSMKRALFESILSFMKQPIPSDCDELVQIWYVINRVEELQPGLYKDGMLVKKGDFSQMAQYLCLEQSLASESAVTFFLTSSAQNYQPLYQKAGHIGHRAYIAATYFGLGCSGIGAYYDDEVKAFLQTDDMVLYALAVGE
jgi:hypothetical protein